MNGRTNIFTASDGMNLIPPHCFLNSENVKATVFTACSRFCRYAVLLLFNVAVSDSSGNTFSMKVCMTFKYLHLSHRIVSYFGNCYVNIRLIDLSVYLGY